MKRRILLTFCIAPLVGMLALTGCGSKEEVPVVSNVVEEDVEQPVDMHQTAVTLDSEFGDEEGGSQETTTSGNNTGETTDIQTGDKNYTVEDVNNAVLFDDVRMYYDTEQYTLDMTKYGDTLRIYINNSVGETSMDMYATADMVYAEIKADGETRLCKTPATSDTDFSSVSPSVNAFGTATYVETVTEDGKTYDVVRVTEAEAAEGMTPQTFNVYINTETKMADILEAGDGSKIHIEAAKPIEVPETLLHAADLDDPTELPMMMMGVMLSGMDTSTSNDATESN